MCYNISYLEARAERVKKHYGVQHKLPLLFENVYHISGFAHPFVPVITSEEPYLLQGMQWGLVPNWCKDEEQAMQIRDQTLNAKSETIFEKPSFRTVARKRCLVVVTGFYEWHSLNKQKYPFYIHLKSRDFFSLGGIYDTWLNKNTGEIINSFAIVTVAANPMMEQIHNTMKRMPFIVPIDKEQEWLRSNLSKDEIKDMMQPYDEQEMEAFTVSKRLTDRNQSNNSPEVMEPAIYPELALFGW